MSFTQTPKFNSMGNANKPWGVCGITSSFYAMYATKPGTRALLNGAGIPTRVMAEVKTYLGYLEFQGAYTVLREIETFTKSFGNVPGFADFSDFTIFGDMGPKGKGYIDRIRKSGLKTDGQIVADPFMSIGLPPQSVADYLSRIWGIQTTIQPMTGGSGTLSDGIVGVKDTKGSMTMYGGLCHFVYSYNGKIYSWADEFVDVAAGKSIGMNFEPCVFIKIA